MKIHAAIHGPTEGLGSIADWAQSRGHDVTETHLYRGETLPPLDGIDFAIIMGGAMNVYQHRDFPWLVPEKRWIAAAIDARKRVLGVCLGAQLIADVLGAKVLQNVEKEIGWFPVRMLARPKPFSKFPVQLTAFHWHGDTFELPHGATRVAESDGCANQAFVAGDRVVGLQFHIEVAPAAVAQFIAGGESEMQPARFVQSAPEICAGPPEFTASALAGMLDALAGTAD
ncbi:MAG TPA: type 1 glutamine amidotransferase [Chthoniobacteraceae bacterium]|nr:type 1 glutamine amidotransferase [Chthoniobacteraceae bacterium]